MPVAAVGRADPAVALEVAGFVIQPEQRRDRDVHEQLDWSDEPPVGVGLRAAQQAVPDGLGGQPVGLGPGLLQRRDRLGPGGVSGLEDPLGVCPRRPQQPGRLGAGVRGVRGRGRCGVRVGVRGGGRGLRVCHGVPWQLCGRHWWWRRPGDVLAGEAGDEQVEAQGVQAARVTGDLLGARGLGQGLVPARQGHRRAGHEGLGLTVVVGPHPHAPGDRGPGGPVRGRVGVEPVDQAPGGRPDPLRGQRRQGPGDLAVDLPRRLGVDGQQLRRKRLGTVARDLAARQQLQGARQVPAEQDRDGDLMGGAACTQAPGDPDLLYE